MSENPVAEIVSEVAAEMRPSPAVDKLIEQAQAVAPAVGASESPESLAGEGGGAAPPAGETFDPAIHEAGPDGGPIYCADGTMRRRRGRKPTRGPNGKFQAAEPAAPVDANATPTAEAAPEPVATADEARVAATATVAVIISIGMMIGGEEWRPKSSGENPTGVDERDNLIQAWEEYYLTSGIKNIPPWAGIAIVTGMYVMPRLSQPKTSGRIQSFFGWVKGLTGRIRV